MQVLKEIQGLYIATLATVLVAVQQSFYQVTMFRSFVVYNVMLCCDNIIPELSYIQRGIKLDTECTITEVHGLKAASHEGPGSGGGTGYTVVIVNLC